ncbi:DUF2515 family protein [Anaerobacillus sp. HL2]|nr:DUF2515 family protein [Anaerobacillus sp. HL2]
MHNSAVIFRPLKEICMDILFGFKRIENRILLGKRLAWLLFYSKEHRLMRQFASRVEHTGSKYDYERFVETIKRKRTPKLLDVYPVIHHHRSDFTDWYHHKNRKSYQSINKKSTQF